MINPMIKFSSLYSSDMFRLLRIRFLLSVYIMCYVLKTKVQRMILISAIACGYMLVFFFNMLLISSGVLFIIYLFFTVGLFAFFVLMIALLIAEIRGC